MSFQGLRHGTLSLISASVEGRPEMALAKLRAMMAELGHPIRGSVESLGFRGLGLRVYGKFRVPFYKGAGLYWGPRKRH